MDEVFCSFCGIEIENNTVVYGVTRGCIDESSYGFRVDDDSEWDIYCPDCMNAIDALIAGFKRTKNQ